jgi:hypothetical protein
MGKKTDISKPEAPSAPEAKAAVAKKPAAKKSVAKTPRKKAVVTKNAFTHDDIALRAYFIAEKRQKAGLPGNPQHDWIEAERQLTAESKKKAAAKSA